jgi:hypothetical protein
MQLLTTEEFAEAADAVELLFETTAFTDLGFDGEDVVRVVMAALPSSKCIFRCLRPCGHIKVTR